jgi:hypothetical protein
MIYELCQEVQNYLYDNNKPPPKSFYEERLQSKLIEQEEPFVAINPETSPQLAEKKIINDKLTADLHQVVDFKRKIIHEERRREIENVKKDRLLSNNTSPSPAPLNRFNKNSEPKDFCYDPTTVAALSNKINYDTQGDHELQKKTAPINNNSKRTSITTSTSTPTTPTFPFLIEFQEPQHRLVKCTKAIKHHKETCMTVYRGVDQETSDILTVYVWNICLKLDFEVEKKRLEMCEKECHKLIDEMKRLQKIKSPLLLKYLGFKFFKDPNKNIYVVELCLDFCEGNSFEYFINYKHSILFSNLKVYTRQIIDALESLHSNHLYHKDLKPSSIYLNSDGSILLADYWLVKKINDLSEAVTSKFISPNIAHVTYHCLNLKILNFN